MRIADSHRGLAGLGVALLALGGCGDEDNSVQPTSTLNLALTDAPLESATKVWVQFTGVEVKPTGGPAQSFSFSPGKGFDLLTLQNGNAATLLGDSTVPAGGYEWVRLIVDPAAGSSYVVDGTGQHNLRIPSGAETGLKLVRGFTMPAGGRADFTIDFQLDKSIITPPGQSPDYQMKPVLRMTNNVEVGTLTGTIAAATLAAIPACTGKEPTVYLYNGAGVVPDDLFNPLNGGTDTAPAVDPLVTAEAVPGTAGAYTYKIAFVQTGSYTVAFTCDSDDPAIDENTPPATPLAFTVYPQAVTVTAGQTATANF
jgi:hypothetical protein